MKVVLFCGGFGMRMREYSERIPKPLVKIGYRPILWQVMKYYAHFGHKDFILCLGWQGSAIKDYFLNYDECVSNDFVLSGGGDEIKLLNRDIDDWTITFADTGTRSNIGERLKAVEPYLEGEKTFLANYTDGLSDLPLNSLIDFHQQEQAVASFISVRPAQSFHAVSTDKQGRVSQIQAIAECGLWMNGGFFVFDHEIFDYLHEGEELVEEPFHRLIRAGRLSTMRYDGFWCCLDTYKEKQALDDMQARGESPWELWKLPTQAAPATGLPLSIPTAINFQT